MNKERYIVLIVVIALLFGWREYSHYADKKATEASYEAVITYNETEKAQLKNSLDLKVADVKVMEQNIMSEKVAKEQLGKELEGYKNITAYMKSEVITSIKNLEAKYNEPKTDPFEGISLLEDEYIHKDVVSSMFVRVPKPFGYSDDWMSINGVVNKEAVTIDSLGIFNKFDAIIGYKKPEGSFSFLKKKSPVVELISYSPYTKINYVNNVVVNNDKGKVGNILLSKPAMLIYGFIGGRAF